MSHVIKRTDQFPHAIRLLRCRKSHRYFTGRGWSADPGQAEVFDDEIDAARACVCHDLKDVELVVRAAVSGTELFSTPVR